MCPSSGELTVSMRHWYFGQLCAHQQNLLYICDTGNSGNYVPIISRTYCIYATLVLRGTMCPSSAELTLSMRHWYFGQLCAHHRENLLYLCDTGISGNYVPIISTTYCIYATLVFRATMCPSSGELTVCMRHWYFGQLCVHQQENLLYLCDTGISGNYVTIISRTYCIYATLVLRANMWPSLAELTVSMRQWYFGQLCAHQQENLLYLCDTGTSGNYVPINRTYCIYATLVFRATMCPSLAELTASMPHWYFGQLCAHYQQNLLYLCDTGTSGNYVPVVGRTYCIYATLILWATMCPSTELTVYMRHW